MKVLMINGSPRKNGNTATALNEMKKIFEAEGFEIAELNVGGLALKGCMNCSSCRKTGKCIIDDEVNQAAKLLEECDGIVVGSPVYYSNINGSLMTFMQRLFYSNGSDKRYKVACAVLAARRGGITASFDELNKFFLYNGMAVAGGQYWNGIHGQAVGEAEQDGEGLQQMRTAARNMVFLMKSIKLGKEQFGLPETEEKIKTSFIR